MERDLFSNLKDRRMLAQAIVDTVREPLVVLDGDLRVVTASRSFYRAFQVNREDTQGCLLFKLGNGQWDIPILRHLLEEILPQHSTLEAFEVDHDFPVIGRRTMLLNARKVYSEESNTAHLLLAIEDVTERRSVEQEKDELLRQKDLLMQEMQHRVVNSLEIIASILLLKARTVQSEETRRHLEDARQRVMSMAAVQNHLQATELNAEIAIGPYLSKLCESLGKSMISERRPLSLEVQANGGSVTSSNAVSLGLITTELVINALKHAFPARYEGRVIVMYDCGEGGWRLSVTDNGVGLETRNRGGAPSGLGTSLVEVLARQLRASVKVSSSPQGTTVSISQST